MVGKVKNRGKARPGAAAPSMCNIKCTTTSLLLLLLLLLSTWGRCCRISLHTATVHKEYFKARTAQLHSGHWREYRSVLHI